MRPGPKTPLTAGNPLAKTASSSNRKCVRETKPDKVGKRSKKKKQGKRNTPVATLPRTADQRSRATDPQRPEGRSSERFAARFNPHLSILDFSLRWTAGDATSRPSKSSAVNMSRDHTPRASLCSFRRPSGTHTALDWLRWLAKLHTGQTASIELYCVGQRHPVPLLPLARDAVIPRNPGGAPYFRCGGRLAHPARRRRHSLSPDAFTMGPHWKDLCYGLTRERYFYFLRVYFLFVYQSDNNRGTPEIASEECIVSSANFFIQVTSRLLLWSPPTESLYAYTVFDVV